MRLFAAITPPVEVLDHLENALSMLGTLPAPPARSGRGAGGRGRRAALRSPWTPRDTWHITLAFFGDVPEGTLPDLTGGLDATVREVEPFAVRLAGAGVFRSTVMWVGVSGETEPLVRVMHDLADVGAEVAGARDSRERNRAHLTISRAGATVDPGHVAHALSVYRGPEWTVDAVELVESRLGQGAQGRPLHTLLETFSLAGRDPSEGRAATGT